MQTCNEKMRQLLARSADTAGQAQHMPVGDLNLSPPEPPAPPPPTLGQANNSPLQQDSGDKVRR
jgi:hypothetical protein